MSDKKPGFGQLMKQAQQLQANMAKAQEDLSNMKVTGQAGGGLFKVLMNGKHIVKKLAIDPSLLKEDKAVIEDIIIAGINDAVQKVEKAYKEKMSGLASGINLPGGFDMPFGDMGDKD